MFQEGTLEPSQRIHGSLPDDFGRRLLGGFGALSTIVGVRNDINTPARGPEKQVICKLQQVMSPLKH